MTEPDLLDRQLATMAPHRAILRAVEGRLMRSVELAGPVLDIGAGDGHFAEITYGEPIEVGIDVRATELAEAGARGSRVYRTLVRADGTGLPFADAAFRTVVSNCVIEHIPDVESVLAEIARVLRPGGTFATTLPSEHFGEYLLGSSVLRSIRLRRAAHGYERFFNRISYHEHVDPPEVWRQRLDAVGLDLVDHQYYFSARAHRAFDLCHYLGVPHLISRKVTGRWVPHPALVRPFERWLRSHYEEPLPQPTGAYQFVRCVRRA